MEPGAASPFESVLAIALLEAGQLEVIGEEGAASHFTSGWAPPQSGEPRTLQRGRRPFTPPVSLLLTITAQQLALQRAAKAWPPEGGIHRSSGGEPRLAGAPRSDAMSLPDARPQANLLSEFALATLSAFGLGLPIAVAIIWICS